MSAAAVAAAKAALAALTDERARKAAGWLIVAILSPVIVVLALFCSLAAGAADHNTSAAELCFQEGSLSDAVPAEYQTAILSMRESFSLLDQAAEELQAQMEEGTELDLLQIKAACFALGFGAGPLTQAEAAAFADCFATWEERTSEDTEEAVLVPVPLEDLDQVWARLETLTGIPVTMETQSNAQSVYQLIRDGRVGEGAWSAGPPLFSPEGFCSPVGAGWEAIVTSEFGYRRDPFTGEVDGHSGMDLAVPTGTAVRSALAGTVTAARYDSSYGYYVHIDHGGGLSTLYAHCSQLLVRAGQTVQAGEVVARSGSTGRSTGPHLHFEVRVNGQRTDPRSYLPSS